MNLLKGGGVLVPCVLVQAVARDVAPVSVDLVRDDAEHGLRDRLAGLQQPTGKPQGAELQREAKPVPGFAAAADTPKIVVQRVAPSALALVVWKLDRLGCDLAHLVATVRALEERRVGFRVLAGQGAEIDTGPRAAG